MAYYKFVCNMNGKVICEPLLSELNNNKYSLCRFSNGKWLISIYVDTLRKNEIKYIINHLLQQYNFVSQSIQTDDREFVYKAYHCMNEYGNFVREYPWETATEEEIRNFVYKKIITEPKSLLGFNPLIELLSVEISRARFYSMLRGLQDTIHKNLCSLKKHKV